MFNFNVKALSTLQPIEDTSCRIRSLNKFERVRLPFHMELRVVTFSFKTPLRISIITLFPSKNRFNVEENALEGTLRDFHPKDHKKIIPYLQVSIISEPAGPASS